MKQREATPEVLAPKIVELIENDASATKCAPPWPDGTPRDAAEQIAESIMQAIAARRRAGWQRDVAALRPERSTPSIRRPVNQLDSGSRCFASGGNRESCACVKRTNSSAELKAALSAATVLREDEPLARRTTLRVGGGADFYAEPASEAELAHIAASLRRASDCHSSFWGAARTCLVKDGGIRGLVICLAHPHFSRIEITGYRLHCGAGAKLKQVAAEAKRSGIDRPGISGGHSGHRRRRVAHERRRDGRLDV